MIRDRSEWDDLSDAELRAKLENRDIPPNWARAAVLGREREATKRIIDRWLGVES